LVAIATITRRPAARASSITPAMPSDSSSGWAAITSSGPVAEGIVPPPWPCQSIVTELVVVRPPASVARSSTRLLPGTSSDVLTS
jgi:hypothetical protein